MSGAVGLRGVVEDDLPVLFEHQRDPLANRMAAFPPRDREAFLAHWRKILSDRAVTARTVLLDDEVAGYITSFDRSGVHEVGYWIGRAYWGRGIATAALRLFLDHDPVRPLYAHVAVQNVGSIRVLEKCGFTRTEEAVEGPDDGVEEILLKFGA